MNKLLFFIAILSVFNIQAQDNEIDYVIISGNIANANHKVFNLKGIESRVITKLEIDVAGNFNDTIYTTKQKFVLYEGINNAYIKLSPGDNIRLNADADNFLNTLIFEGEGANLNNYLIGSDNLFLEENKSYSDKYSKSEVEFTTFKKEWKQKRMEFLNASNGLSSEFIEIEKRNIYYCYTRDFINFEKYHIKYTNNDEFKISKHFLDEFIGFDWENEQDYKETHFYPHLIHDRIKNNFIDENPTDTFDYIAFLRYINKNIKNRYIRDMVLYENSEYNITYTNNLEEFYNAFCEGIYDKDLKAKITETYVTLSFLLKGKSSPKFVNYENYNGGVNSLDDYLGKFVYIDIWAAWCPPCIEETPHLKELKETYKDKNIEFVSISVDYLSDYDKWREKVEEQEMDWTQLYADNSWDSEFIKAYSVKGIPRYILLDTNGNIINSNAPRPSDSKLLELIDGLYE